MALIAIISGTWLSAFLIAFGVSEWRDREKSTDRCQAAAAYFDAVNSLTSSTERIGIAGPLAIHGDDTVVDAWTRAFEKMKDECS